MRLVRNLSLILMIFIFNVEIKVSALADWTILVFIQADNNLAPFVEYDITEMSRGIYSNSSNVNILIQWDQPFNSRTWRYKIVKNGLIEDESLTQEMGLNPVQELVDSASWIKQKYPAKRYSWILWNHGSGIEDYKNIKISNLFQPEIPKTLKKKSEQRGILFDFTQNTYLSNQGLTSAFSQIKSILGQKVDLIGMDACLMEMIEVAYQLKDLTNVLVGSQQTTSAYGWAYAGFINPLTRYSSEFGTKELAQAIVLSFGDFYNKMGELDYTQSAFDMQYLNLIKKNIDQMILKVAACKKHNSRQIKSAVIKARFKSLNFYIPSYIDLYSFYQKLYDEVLRIKGIKKTYRKKRKGRKRKIKKTTAYLSALDDLKRVLYEGQILIKNSIISNAVSFRNQRAQGISIYYPNPAKFSSAIHPSYSQTLFAQESLWLKFITKYRRKPL